VLNPEEMKDDFEVCYQNCAANFECAYKAGISIIDSELIYLGNTSHISQQIMCNFNGIKWENFKICFITGILFEDINKGFTFNFTGSNEEKNTTNAIYFAKLSVIEFIPKEIFTEFSDLQAFAIRDSNIPILKSKLLAHRKFNKVSKLDLSRNKIQFIEKRALISLQGLLEIDLSGNLLKSISHQIFIKNRGLLSIKLYKNKIMMIQENTFSKMDSLSHLDLRRNECINKEFEYDGELVKFAEEPLSSCISKYRESTKYLKKGI
jgi:Leucine-rich repeat (LRR) protein